MCNKAKKIISSHFLSYRVFIITIPKRAKNILNLISSNIITEEKQLNLWLVE